jgi:hypothetical protein
MKDEISLSLSLSLSLWLQQKPSDITSILFLPSAMHFSLVSYCLRVRVDDGDVKVRKKQSGEFVINSPNDARLIFICLSRF